MAPIVVRRCSSVLRRVLLPILRGPGRLWLRLIVSSCAVLFAASCGSGGYGTNRGDPLVVYQWHLQNVGQDVFTGVPGTPGIDLNVMGPLSQGLSGRGVSVMVVDTGVEILHPDLKDRIDPTMLHNFDPTASDANDPTPPVGGVAHGTAVAGIIAATADNGLGGQGVAPQATLGAARWICDGCQTTTSTISIFGGAPFSLNVDVFNGSFGSDPWRPLQVEQWEIMLLQHLETMRGGLGAVFAKSAGNEFKSYSDEDAPASLCVNANKNSVTCVNANNDPWNGMPQVVTVAAVNAMGKRSSYSSASSNILVSGLGGEYGYYTANIPNLPANFPAGPAIVTTDLTGCNQGYSSSQNVGQLTNPFDVPGSAVNTSLNADCDYTASMNGTSSAAPTVAGVVALLLEANPKLTWRDVRTILMKTARHIDASRVPTSVVLPSGEQYVPEPAWTKNAAGYWFDNWYGFGLVDGRAAVDMARGYTTYLTGAMLEDTASFPANGQSGEPVEPQGDATGLEIKLPASGNVQSVEYVQVSIDMVSADLSDLAVEVISPGGTRSVLQNAYNGYENTGAPVEGWLLASNAFNGESALGTWTIRFIDVDTRGGAPMQFAGVTLNVLGH